MHGLSTSKYHASGFTDSASHFSDTHHSDAAPEMTLLHADLPSLQQNPHAFLAAVKSEPASPHDALQVQATTSRHDSLQFLDASVDDGDEFLRARVVACAQAG